MFVNESSISEFPRRRFPQFSSLFIKLTIIRPIFHQGFVLRLQLIKRRVWAALQGIPSCVGLRGWGWGVMGDKFRGFPHTPPPPSLFHQEKPFTLILILLAFWWQRSMGFWIAARIIDLFVSPTLCLLYRPSFPLPLSPLTRCHLSNFVVAPCSLF